MFLPAAWFVPARDQACQILAVFEKPARMAGELLQPLEHRTLQHLDSEDRDQSDHRAHLERHSLAAGKIEDVVIKFVLFVPQPDSFPANICHRLGDVEKMLEEFDRDVLVDRVFEGEFKRDAQQIQGVHCHPGSAVGLVYEAAGGQRRTAVKDADIVKTEKPALKYIPALGVLAVDPPGEVQHQLVKYPLEEMAVPTP